MAFLRAVRPVAKNAGKLTRYGKFMRGLKYTGYAASAGVFAYEIADMLGAVPDVKYQEVTRQLNEIHDGRVKDLEILKNITLITVNTNNNITDISIEVSTVLSEANNKFEIMIKVSQVFGSYLQQLSNSLLLLMQGNIPSSLISLELQREWLERNLPSPLLNHIGSITPHLEVKLKAIDETNNQLILAVEVPTTGSRFKILNYVYWEPKVVHNGICYTSPKTSLLLAYPLELSTSSEVPKPLLIDPESCMTNGYIMCESDSILDQIPMLSLNRICTKELGNSEHIRSKRNSDDLFLQASSPVYDISRIVNKTLSHNNALENTRGELNNLQMEIERLLSSAKEESKRSKIAVENADRDSFLIKVLFVIITPIVLWLFYLLFNSMKKSFMVRRERNVERRRKMILSQLGAME